MANGIGVVLALCAIASTCAAYWLRSPVAKPIAVLGILVSLFGDALYGEYELSRACNEDGGVTVYRKLNGVKGFYSPYAGPIFLEKYGYSYIEAGNARAGFVRYEKTTSGIVRETITKPQSKYIYRVVRDDDRRKLFVRDHFQVVVAGSDELLGQVVRTRFAGGWVQRATAALWAGDANAGVCELSNPGEIEERLISATLIPTKNGS